MENKEILIVKVNCLLPKEQIENIKQYIKKGIEEGIIVLGPHLEITKLTIDDVQCEVEVLPYRK